MIPLRDTIPRKHLPIVTWALLAVTSGVFVWQVAAGTGLATILDHHAFVPERFFSEVPSDVESQLSRLRPLASSIFLHGGWLHLLGNMLFLFVFGDNVEDSFGHARFLLFYLACGTVATLAQGIASPASPVPVVGASGAIAGVLGAYFVLHPRSRVVTLVPILFFVQVVELPAIVFLLLWILIQLAGAALAESMRGAASVGGGVAWWAHVGGFAAGVSVGLLHRLLRSGRARR